MRLVGKLLKDGLTYFFGNTAVHVVHYVLDRVWPVLLFHIDKHRLIGFLFVQHLLFWLTLRLFLLATHRWNFLDFLFALFFFIFYILLLLSRFGCFLLITLFLLSYLRLFMVACTI